MIRHTTFPRCVLFQSIHLQELATITIQMSNAEATSIHFADTKLLMTPMPTLRSK